MSFVLVKDASGRGVTLNTEHIAKVEWNTNGKDEQLSSAMVFLAFSASDSSQKVHITDLANVEQLRQTLHPKGD